MSNDINHKAVESHIVLGYNCNQHCRHCVVQVKRMRVEGEHEGNLSKDEAVNAIVTAIANGATTIVFTGGEPTLRADLPELVSFCLQRGCKVQIQTNGSFADSIKRVCDSNLDHLSMLEFMIPLHSADPKVHDNICRSENGFYRAIESLQYLAGIGTAIIGKIVLTKFTDDLRAICRLYEKLGAASIIIAYPHCVSFPIETIREVDLKEEETSEIFDAFYRESYKVPIILQAFPRCFIGKHPQAVIQEEQADFLALEVVEHQLRAEDRLQWHTFRKLDKRKFGHCTACKYNNTCEGIWKDYLKAYGDFQSRSCFNT